jgi:DNA-binding MarR family transcriptional regulator
MQSTTAEPVRPDAQAPRSPEESVLHALMSIGRLMRQRLAGDSMEPGTFFLLKGLASQDAMRVTELAAMANLDASTVSRHVQQLHRSGLIERSPDPDDGRAQRVALSPQGRALLHDGLGRRRALLGRSLEGWDPSDVETLDRLLARLVDSVEHNTGREQA